MTMSAEGKNTKVKRLECVQPNENHITKHSLAGQTKRCEGLDLDPNRFLSHWERIMRLLKRKMTSRKDRYQLETMINFCLNYSTSLPIGFCASNWSLCPPIYLLHSFIHEFIHSTNTTDQQGTTTRLLGSSAGNKRQVSAFTEFII